MLLADRGYDADWIRALAARKGALANIPAAMQSQRADLLQPISVSSPQFGREVLQQDQALSPGRNALRQAGGELPRFRSACVDQAMAAR